MTYAVKFRMALSGLNVSALSSAVQRGVEVGIAMTLNVHRSQVHLSNILASSGGARRLRGRMRAANVAADEAAEASNHANKEDEDAEAAKRAKDAIVATAKPSILSTIMSWFSWGDTAPAMAEPRPKQASVLRGRSKRAAAISVSAPSTAEVLRSLTAAASGATFDVIVNVRSTSRVAEMMSTLDAVRGTADFAALIIEQAMLSVESAGGDASFLANVRVEITNEATMTEVATAAPTVAPTVAPTAAPTAAPTPALCLTGCMQVCDDGSAAAASSCRIPFRIRLWGPWC